MPRRLTPALVVSVIALFVALGGVSYAAIAIPINSIGSAQIKKNAVNSSKVKNGSLLAADFKAGQLPAGAKGETGAKGDTGPAGPTASAYASNNVLPNTALSPGSTNFTVLDTSAPGAGSGTMTIATRSRVVADASVTVFKGTGNAALAADVDCQIFATGSSGTVLIGQVARATLTPTVATGAVYAVIGLSGAIDVDPGAYTFGVRCQQANGTGSTGTPNYDKGDLTVIATGI